MKTLLLILTCFFCLATIPAMADYACVVEAKGCSSEQGKNIPDDKTIACQQCECCISGYNVSNPASSIANPFITQLQLASTNYLKPSCIVGPPLEPPTV